MLDSQSKVQNPKFHLSTVLPLPDAARKYNLTEQALTQLIQAGKIEAVQLPSGELLVSDNNQKSETKKEIIAKEFAHLQGQRISASEASRKYSSTQVTIYPARFSDWAKAGYIKVLDQGYRLLLDEADVAYCAKIYRNKFEEYGGRLSGVSLFDEEGNPYQLRYPEMAAYKRTLRHRGRQRGKQVASGER